MGQQKKCPSCGRQIGKEQGKCPYCGMEGLNRIFASEADYTEWVRSELNPHKAKLLPCIFAGSNGVLILHSDGKLYGMGNNDTGSFGEKNKGRIVGRPQLVAENIKCAAAGYCYNLCLTQDGQIMLVGRTGIPYRNRLEQMPDVEEVFAAPDRDIFWILTKDKSLYVWGDNRAEDIAPMVSKELHRFNYVEIDVEYWDSVTKTYVYRTNGPAYDIFQGSSGSDRKQGLENVEIRLKQSDLYRQYARIYGDDNLRIEFTLGSRKLCANNIENEKEFENVYGGSVTKNTWERYKETYQPRLTYTNWYIYKPVRVADAKKYLPGICCYGSGVIPCSQNVDEKTVKKIAKFKMKNIWHQAVLKTDGSLELWDDKKRLRTISDVEDVAVATKIYILTKTGKLMEGDPEDLISQGMTTIEFTDRGAL